MKAIDATLHYGRRVYTRGAVVHAIGRKEVAKYAKEEIDLSHYEGTHVVCSLDGTILTTYRNRKFKGLRANLDRGRHRGRYGA